MAIEFFIPMQVKPKQGGQHGKGRHWQPEEVTENARGLALYAQQHAPEDPLTGPVCVAYHFTTRWWQRAPKKLRAQGMRFKATSPDLGNKVKQLDDVLEAAGFFVNDGQIAKTQHEDLWADDHGVWVKVSELSEAAT